MRTTVVELQAGTVVTDVRDEPDWLAFEKYDGPPLHDWHAIAEATLLSVCLVRQAG